MSRVAAPLASTPPIRREPAALDPRAGIRARPMVSGEAGLRDARPRAGARPAPADGEQVPAGAPGDGVPDARREFLAARTFGERVADRIAAFGGSWTFILLFFGFLVAWTGLNTVVLARSHHAFDAYPYIFLNLMLSTLAALQAPVIMMSQQRQTVRDRVAAVTDYDVNCKAEREIRALHDKLDTLREAQWAELVLMQQQQIALLERLLATSARAPDSLPVGAPA